MTWESIGEPINSDIQICPADHHASVMWRGDGQCPLCEAEKERDELKARVEELEHLVELHRYYLLPILESDPDMIYKKTTQLKQSDAEGWAIGESVRYVVANFMKGAKE